MCNIPYVTAILNAFMIEGVGVRPKNEVGEGRWGKKMFSSVFPTHFVAFFGFPQPPQVLANSSKWVDKNELNFSAYTTQENANELQSSAFPK